MFIGLEVVGFYFIKFCKRSEVIANLPDVAKM